MIRWVAVACLLAGLTAPAGAQVFKPKSGSASTTKSTAKTGSSSAKKSSTSSKKSARKSKKKSAAASKGRPSDLTPDDAPKVDPDYVKIIDDDE
jgi:ribosome-binding protein aMBF1 (putative translation factor)